MGKKAIMSLLGNIFIAIGVALFKLSGQGNDPFGGMNMALAEVTGVQYGTFQLLLNIVLLVIQIITARELLGIGTIINAGLLGYMVTFFYDIFIMIGKPELFVIKLVVLTIGVLICSLGLSVYQKADCGVAPYDALPVIVGKKLKNVPFFWRRMMFDVTCTLVCFLASGIIGLGTLAAAFGLGPLISVYNKILFKSDKKA